MYTSNIAHAGSDVDEWGNDDATVVPNRWTTTTVPSIAMMMVLMIVMVLRIMLHETKAATRAPALPPHLRNNC